ncbi:MAG TPA: aldo/keto reductase [Usitatibacter sp.]|jgi:aryl-alcohol dehydrogenase-like predicted oxidoreductase
MKKRKLGQSGFEVAPLAFGGNVFGWTVDEPTAFRLLDTFVEHGFSLVDTADTYSKWAEGNHGGESETVIGNWLAQGSRRDRVVVATKCGMEMPEVGKGLSKKHILRSAEDSLKRLRTDHIDVYQAHEEDTSTPIDETLEAYAQLVRDGKVRAIGASNYSPAGLAAALDRSEKAGLPRYQTLQPRYNLYSREFEKELQALCVARGVGVISYFPLAAGFLTGKYRTEKDLAQSARGGGIKRYMDDRGMRILGALEEVAKSLHAKMAQVALAWVMARPGIAAPIASATTLAQLRELMAAADLVLDEAASERLDSASA